jgi:transcriptional regulator GlxA family with amidase domain
MPTADSRVAGEPPTHWAWCDILAQRYPNITVRPQRALVVSGEGRLVMAGGGSSWLDLALYLIARTAGIEHAMHTARINLIDWHDVGQQPFARLARSRQSEDAGIAERSFKRRFLQATGMSPLEYMHTLRLEEAKQMLEASDEPIEAIANEVGYEDAGFFSRLFRRSVGLSPAQYRKRFGGLRRALESGA